MSVTSGPRCGTMVISPSACRCCSDSRRHERLTSRLSHNSRSDSFWPGANTPSRMAVRRVCVVRRRSDVSSRGTRSIWFMG